MFSIVFLVLHDIGSFMTNFFNNIVKVLINNNNKDMITIECFQLAKYEAKSPNPRLVLVTFISFFRYCWETRIKFPTIHDIVLANVLIWKVRNLIWCLKWEVSILNHLCYLLYVCCVWNEEYYHQYYSRHKLELNKYFLCW